ncbi:MAG: single-strand selective monofunctional uracil DNA glycosylase [Planctomycetota bacterium]|nr:MAG: single-strand selective monofunctional uracil DNA glycosylase [Planctomycetota bacterium]
MSPQAAREGAAVTVLEAARRLREAVRDYPARAPAGRVAYILLPLEYAWELHAAYCRRFAPPGHRVEAVLLGMNPGPWGMGQTGVPFGSPDMVRDFLGLRGRVRQPARMHPRRPVLGLDCPRNEVSGQRLWGAVRDCFGTPEAFFARFYVANYCPLLLLAASGANLTPERAGRALLADCLAAADLHLERVLRALAPRTVIGVGRWAAARARAVVERAGLGMRTGMLLHPSPASPQANRGWRELALAQLRALGHPWPAPASSR